MQEKKDHGDFDDVNAAAYFTGEFQQFIFLVGVSTAVITNILSRCCVTSGVSDLMDLNFYLLSFN